MKTRIKNFFPSLTFSSPFSRLPLSYLLLTFLTLFAGSVASAQIPSSGLVGYWPFNGNANDESGNGNNGTVNGGALLVTDRNGNANAAYQFDGIDDFIQMIQAGPTGNAAVTVSFWMRTTMAVNNGPGEGVGHVFGYGANDINQPGRSFTITVNGSAWVNSCNQAITFETHGAALSKTDVFNNSWNHYSIVNDPSAGDNVINQKIYKNGVLMSQTCFSSPGVPANPTNFSNAAPIRIGKFYGNNCQNCQVGIPYFFQGALDDFSMYNRVLTPSEITQLYTDQTSLVEVPCTPFLGEDQTVCAGTSVTLSASGSSLACPTLPSTLQTGLVGYWPFCGNANDASGNGNNGTVNGATLTTDRFGNANSAYNFNGNSYVQVASTPALNCNNAISINAWVLSNSNSTDGIIVSKERYASGMSYSLATLFSDYGMGVNNAPGDISCPSCNLGTWGVNSVLPGSWQNLTSVWDGITCKLYLNGQLISTSNGALPFNGTLLSSNLPLFIGKWMQDLDSWGFRYFNGKIDDVSIHNRALSATEIQQLYTLGQSTYLWSTGATTSTINVTPTTTTTYTCTVTDANGNACTDSVTVFVPQIEATDLTICAGETTALSVSGINPANTSCSALPTNLQTGLVGYWPFCGNANDASGNGNNGTVNGATLTTDRFGNANSAYYFNGTNSKIDFNSQFVFHQSSNASVSFWIYGEEVLSNVYSSVFWSRLSVSDYNRYNLYLSPLESNIMNVTLDYRTSSGGVGNQNLHVLNNYNPIGYNAWNQFSITREGDLYKFYLNGVLVNQVSDASASLPSEIGWMLGLNPNGNHFFKGKIDEFLMLNRALTASEIQALYISGQTTYLWSTGATTPSINVSPASTTTYTCTVTTNGVTCTDDITVVVDTPIATITPATTTTFCQGGSVVLNANTGAGLSYQWKLNGTNISGAISSSYTANASGSYTVVVTNTSTCSATSTATVVTVNALPTATITASTATTFCQGGSVVLNANNGTGLTYQWRLNGTNITGATTSTYTANASGSFTVVVTNTSTCSATSTATVVTVNALPTATITSSSATTFCQGGSVVLTANTGTGLSYQWRLNGTNITGATTSSYTANASGSYTVVVTNTSTCSATSMATVVTVNALPTATITPATATTFCQGGSVVLNANTGTGLSYQWKLNGTNITGATSASYTANASGSYTVVVTNTSTCSATSAATVVTVNALPTATITASSATTFCQGGSVVLNANTGTGLTYQWKLNGTNITGATSSSFTANASGSYTVVVTNTSTCSATSTASVVTVNALPTATITASSATTFCQGGSVVLTANTGTGLLYQWRLNGTNITGATTSSYTANASGSYTVVVTNTSTCSATSAATVVTVNALPTSTITPATATTFCQGGSVVLNANTGAGLSYQWFNNAVAISGATTSTYTANASGSYTVVVTNTSTCSVTSAATIVTVNALPTATITPATATTFCQGGSVVLNANTGTGLTYQWKLNGTNITGATSASYTANASGSYTVVVTNTSTCSATSTATVVTVNALPTATITPATTTTFCQGGSVVLNANTGTGLTYQWFNNAVAISGATSSSYTANASGSYTVVVTNTSTCSATSTATVVTVNALPSSTITPATATTFCQGGSVVLSANTGTGLSYQWKLNGTNITGATSSSYTANASGSYTVVVTNSSTCSATSTATVVTVNALPTATITPATVTTFCQGGSVVLNANTGTGLSYQWRLNGTNITGATSVSYTANASGSYTVVVTNTSTCSAISTATVVTVIPNVDYFADADGDGFGDAATLVSTCIQPQGYVTNNSDCDDTSADVNPAATEVCNHIDDDCSGTIDDGLVFNTYYADADGDTFGDANNSIYECSQPSGYVTNNTDCNDNNANQNAASAEICNGEDDDCDGAIDNGLIFLDYYADLDSDGFGAGTATNSCVDLGAGYVTNNTDCNDNNANQNTASTEI